MPDKMARTVYHQKEPFINDKYMACSQFENQFHINT